MLEEKSEPIFVIGLNHKTAPVAIREKVAFNSADAVSASRSLLSSDGLEEVLILSTCNRTELYLRCHSRMEIFRWLSNYLGFSFAEIEPHLYVHEGFAVLDHAARVASGLDSMVIGETQILGQIKDAYRRSIEIKSLGASLDKIFQTAFAIAKDVRTKTEVGAHSVSLASAALKASARIFDDLSAQRVLFVGAGEMIRLCAKHFSSAQFKGLAFSNRTKSSADTLATEFAGTSLAFESLHYSLSDFDILISCTSSPIPIIGKGSIEVALKQRKHRPIVLFDLAVPRDIEEEISALEDVFLFTIDDLGDLVVEGVKNREQAIVTADSIIERGVLGYTNWSSSRDTLPVLRAFRNHGETLVQDELDRALASLRKGVDPELVINRFANSLKSRFLDRPSRALNSAKFNDKQQLASALAKLFNLDETE